MRLSRIALFGSLLLAPVLATAQTIDSSQITIDSLLSISGAQFGSLTIAANNQELTGAITPRPAFLSGGAASFETLYFDLAGNTFVPSLAQYQIDDLASGDNILPATVLPPAPGNVIVVSAAQNAMISVSRDRETHVLTVIVTDSLGDTYRQRALFDVLRSP